MVECSQNFCTLDKGQFRLNNNKWGQPGASQSIFVIDPIIGWQWSNPGGGYNYPEVVVGTNFGQWPSTSPYFPIQYKNVKTWYAELTYKYTQKPTGSWWNFAFDIYWMDANFRTKYYNIMIWFNGNAQIGDPYVKDVNDGYNIYKYYHGRRSWPWDAFILKNQLTDPVVGHIYTYQVNIKKLIDAIDNPEFVGSGEWYIPDTQVGNENENGAGRVEISAYNIEINGNWIRLNPPVTRYRCTGSPDFQCVIDPNGPYAYLAECQAACIAPPRRFRCTGSPDFLCIEDPNGPYATLAECQAACVAPSKRYRCTGSPDFLCIEDPNGPYLSLAECQAACVAPQTKKFKIYTIGNQGVSVVKSSRGDFTADDACIKACNIIRNIQ